ncbi:MAG: hypothetical protein LUD52_05240 [Opitutae bacterium]|nr:hypothetical protein [Opitutae bacterium]
MEEHYGESQTITDLKRVVQQSGDHLMTGEVSYSQQGDYESVIAGCPKLGSRSRYFDSSVTLQKITISPTTEDRWKVQLSYSDPEYEETGISTRNKDFYLRCVSSTVSILLHPKFANCGEYALSLAKMYLDGVPLSKSMKENKSSDSRDDTDGEGYIPDENGSDTTLGKLINDARKGDKNFDLLISKISKGIRNYLVPLVTWTATSYVSSIPSESKLGKVDTPTGGPPSFGGKRDWLLTGYSATRTKDDELWAVTREWKLSDSDSKWDDDLYS